MARKFICLLGKKFNRLLVLGEKEIRNHRKYWFCQCDCGKLVDVASDKLQSGHTKSCGCLKREKSSQRMIKIGKKYGKINGKIKDNLGEKHSKWKGGKTTHEGYIIILTQSRTNHYKQEHRIIMEQNLGRKLKSQEVVHHINGIRNDNRIDNLMLFANNEEHIKFHKLTPIN